MAMTTTISPIYLTNATLTPNRATYKVALDGPSGVGKSWMVRAMFSPTTPTMVVPTMGVEVHPICYGEDELYNMWDMGGHPTRRGIGEGYYVGSDLALFMLPTYDEEVITNYVRRLHEVVPRCPYLVIVRSPLDTHECRHATIYLPHDGSVSDVLAIMRDILTRSI